MCFTTGIARKKSPKLCQETDNYFIYILFIIAITKTKTSLPKRWKIKLLLFLVGQQSNDPTTIISDWNLAPFLSYALHGIVLFVLSFWALFFSLLLNFCRIRNLCCWPISPNFSLLLLFVDYLFLIPIESSFSEFTSFRFFPHSLFFLAFYFPSISLSSKERF